MDLDGISQWWAAGQFKAKDRFEFYDMLILLLDNGVILRDAVEQMYNIFSENGKKKRNVIARVCQDCAIGLADGKSFADILYRWVSYDEYSLIAAGDKTGTLQQSFKKGMKVIQSKKAVVAAVSTMALYPSFLFFMAVFLLRTISKDLVPKLGRGSNPETWDNSARTLKFIADYVTNYGLITLIGILCFIAAVFISMPFLRGRPRYYLDKLPPYNIYRMLYGSTFLLNVGVLLSAGIKLVDVLEMLAARANPWMKERIQDTLHGIRIGATLGDALHQAGHEFPDKRAVSLLRVISGKKGAEANLESFGERWMEESVKDLAKVSKLVLGTAMALNGALMLLVLVGASGMSDAMINGMRQ